MKNLEKNCLQNQKSPNKLSAGMKRRKKKFADQLIHSLICISKFSPIC